jgi:fatty acid-binding protein DegV
MYEAENPGKQVCVIDSLSAGPELVLIIEKLEALIAQGMPFEDICREIGAYQQQTGLTFMLESLKNFAANGRVSPAVAKIAGVLGIRIVGKASDKGTLAPTDKCRGEDRSLQAQHFHQAQPLRPFYDCRKEKYRQSGFALRQDYAAQAA